MPLHLIGYWRNEEHPEYPDPHDLVDEVWDDDERWVVASYLRRGTVVRAYMGLSPCRFCDGHNGSVEYTDGVLLWPEGLAHYVEHHGVRLPPAVEIYVLRAADRLESSEVSLGWWLAGAPADAPDAPRGPIQRLASGGNVQLAHDTDRRFPGLLVQGDTLSTCVDGPRSRQLLRWYEELMTAAGRDELPYAT